VKKIKVCIRCDKKIEDGRWISVESPGRKGISAGASFNAGTAGGETERKDKGVLCEKCWKNMYLPKVGVCVIFFLFGSAFLAIFLFFDALETGPIALAVYFNSSFRKLVPLN
jgi:hypothetical protein